MLPFLSIIDDLKSELFKKIFFLGRSLPVRKIIFKVKVKKIKADTKNMNAILLNDIEIFDWFIL